MRRHLSVYLRFLRIHATVLILRQVLELSEFKNPTNVMRKDPAELFQENVFGVHLINFKYLGIKREKKRENKDLRLPVYKREARA